ncbi:MAG: hypothetical protein WA667_17345 [Candidatus Nitrosopolaris sp.]
MISASTHIHLDADNCLETIMLKGEIKKLKELANSLSKNPGIKSTKVNFVSVVLREPGLGRRRQNNKVKIFN